MMSQLADRKQQINHESEIIILGTYTFISKTIAIVKLDFSNAFNSIKRDSVLKAVSDKIPQLYKFC